MLWLLLTACSTPNTAAPAPRPDVLVITMDTVRVDALGVYGNRFEPTPTLDAFANTGARFERAYTVTPLTIPAHSSIHTGLYPPHHGVRDNGDYFLSDDAVTLAERLKGAGYETMASVGAEVTSHHWGFAQGFDTYFDDLGPTDPSGNRWQVERPGAEVVDDALSWLSVDHAAPTFAWVHLFDAHSPYEAPEPFASQLEGRPYLAEVAGVDAQVARLLAAVDNDTVVVIVSDHGEGLGDHGESNHGILLYDATTHIPMLVRAPRVTPQVVQTPVSLVDLTPTILGFAGLPIPELDGSDWSGALKGTAPWPADRDLYLESLYASRHFGWAPQHALVDAHYKLIHSTTDKLFARDDRHETTSLAADDALTAPRVARLDAWMADMSSAGVASRVDANSVLIGQLEALGYTASVASPTAGAVPDPEDRIGALSGMEAVREASRSGDFDAIESAVRAVLAVDPGLSEARLTLASALLKAGRAQESADLTTEVLGGQESASAWSLLGSAELRLGRPADGLAHLKAGVDMDPHLVTSWSAYLQALLNSAAADTFLREAERALTLLPEQPEMQGMAGVARAMTGDVEGAQPLLDAALAERPGLPLVRHGLATIAQLTGDNAEAERLYRDEISRFPPGLLSRRHLVTLFASQQDYAQQIAQLEAIVPLEPPSPLTRHALAQARFNAGDYAGALIDVEGCRTLAPSDPGCAMLEANVLKRLGRDDDAEAAHAHALDLVEAARAAAIREP